MKEKSYVVKAPILKRVVAFAIDIIVIDAVILLPFRSTISKIVPETISLSEAYKMLGSIESPLVTSISFAVSLLAITYFVMFEGRLQQSIGKMLMGIYVVSDAKEPSRWQLLVRNLFFIPIFPFMLLWLIEPIFMLFTKSNQRLLEILSKTRVVERYKYTLG